MTLGHKPLPISQEVANNMRMVDFIGYYKSNLEFKSSQALALSKVAKIADTLQPKFHSQLKGRETKDLSTTQEGTLYSVCICALYILFPLIDCNSGIILYIETEEPYRHILRVFNSKGIQES